MKAITLWQPWASAMRYGLKTIETRSWSTKHRGPLAIHAADRKLALADMALVSTLNGARPPGPLPRGCVLGIVELLDVFPMVPGVNGEAVMLLPAGGLFPPSINEKTWGDWKPGRFAWFTRPVEWFAVPIPAKGHQQLWNWERPAAVAAEGESAR